MWRVLKAELIYMRAFLLGGFAIAGGVVVIISVVFYAVGEEGPPSHAAAALRAMFLMMAPMIVGFIAQGLRSEERRARLLLSGPLTPSQLAGAAALLPFALCAIGILAAGVVLGCETLITGAFELESLSIAVYVGGLLFMMQQSGLLIQEAVAAFQQRRPRAATVGWTAFVVAVLIMTVLSLAAVFEMVGWYHLNLGNLIGAFVAGIAAAVLYMQRTDFTK